MILVAVLALASYCHCHWLTGAFSSLLRELVAEFTLTDNPANTTTSLLRSLCHTDDSIILGTWLQETDHKTIEDQVCTFRLYHRAIIITGTWLMKHLSFSSFSGNLPSLFWQSLQICWSCMTGIHNLMNSLYLCCRMHVEKQIWNVVCHPLWCCILFVLCYLLIEQWTVSQLKF